MYESLSMLFVSLCCIVYLFIVFLLFLSLGDEIKLLKRFHMTRIDEHIVAQVAIIVNDPV